MHDIGRTQLEQEGLEVGEYGEAGEVGEYGEVGEVGEIGGQETGSAESPFGEAQEMQLASELLEVSSEEELEQFLGKIIGSVGRAVGQFARSDTGRALGGILKSAAKQALPIVGRAVGQWVSPSRGGDVGARVASAAGQLLGLELEGLSPEDREFEVARQFVRFAGAAARYACAAPRSVPPKRAARIAAATAARTFAPGLAPAIAAPASVHPTTMPQTGRWLRRGRRIVIYLS